MAVTFLVTKGLGGGFLVTKGLQFGGSAPVISTPRGGGTSKRRGRVIRFSDLTERERIEALKDIQVRPFTPIEQAAANLAVASEDDADDDEAILLALMRILH